MYYGNDVCTKSTSPTLFNFVASVILTKNQETEENVDGKNGDLSLNYFLSFRRKEVSRLPFRFGCNAKVLATFTNDKCGIRHIYLKHVADFIEDVDITFKSYDVVAEILCAKLKATFVSNRFLFEEDDPQGRGRRYIWKTDTKFGNARILVTIMVPDINNTYELITAFKRWA